MKKKGKRIESRTRLPDISPLQNIFMQKWFYSDSILFLPIWEILS